MEKINIESNQEELARLRAYNTGMCLTIGMLRGMMTSIKCHLNDEQLEILSNIDKNIHLMFYNHQFKMKE